MIPGLETVDADVIRKFYRKARDYAHAYWKGKTNGKEVEDAVTFYKSHRTVKENK